MKSKLLIFISLWSLITIVVVGVRSAPPGVEDKNEQRHDRNGKRNFETNFAAMSVTKNGVPASSRMIRPRLTFRQATFLDDLELYEACHWDADLFCSQQSVPSLIASFMTQRPTTGAASWISSSAPFIWLEDIGLRTDEDELKKEQERMDFLVDSVQVVDRQFFIAQVGREPTARELKELRSQRAKPLQGHIAETEPDPIGIYSSQLDSALGGKCWTFQGEYKFTYEWCYQFHVHWKGPDVGDYTMKTHESSGEYRKSRLYRIGNFEMQDNDEAAASWYPPNCTSFRKIIALPHSFLIRHLHTDAVVYHQKGFETEKVGVEIRCDGRKWTGAEEEDPTFDVVSDSSGVTVIVYTSAACLPSSFLQSESSCLLQHLFRVLNHRLSEVEEENAAVMERLLDLLVQDLPRFAKVKNLVVGGTDENLVTAVLDLEEMTTATLLDVWLQEIELDARREAIVTRVNSTGILLLSEEDTSKDTNSTVEQDPEYQEDYEDCLMWLFQTQRMLTPTCTVMMESRATALDQAAEEL